MSINEKKTETGNITEMVTVQPANSGEYVVVVLGGKMVYENAENFAAALESKIAAKGCYIFDVDKLERLDSTGFGVLITMARKIAAMEGKVGFAVSNEFTRDLFDIAKFDHVFPIAAKPEEVWQMINGGFQPRISLTQY